MSSKPKQSSESKELERLSIEREKQLRVEAARQKTKTFSDNVAFRKKLRGIFSLLSGGFQGFPNQLGVSTSRGGGGGGTQGGGAGGGRNSTTGTGGGRSGGGGGVQGGSPIARTFNPFGSFSGRGR